VAPSFLAFFGVRTLLGGASHVDNPVSSSLVADYYPPLARGRVYAVQRLTVVIGTGVGVGVGGLVGGALGWRWAYVVAAVPGLLVALVVARLREPARGALDRPGAIDGLDRTDGLDRIDGPPVALLEAIDDPAPRPGPGGLRAYLGEFRRVLDIRTIRSVSLGLAVTVLGIAGIAYWLPTFFERDFGLSAASAAALTAVAAITAGVVGALVGGTLGDRIEARRPGGRIALTAGAVVVGTLRRPRPPGDRGHGHRRRHPAVDRVPAPRRGRRRGAPGTPPGDRVRDVRLRAHPRERGRPARDRGGLAGIGLVALGDGGRSGARPARCPRDPPGWTDLRPRRGRGRFGPGVTQAPGSVPTSPT
jgi:hypothetical protein